MKPNGGWLSIIGLLGLVHCAANPTKTTTTNPVVQNQTTTLSSSDGGVESADAGESSDQAQARAAADPGEGLLVETVAVPGSSIPAGRAGLNLSASFDTIRQVLLDFGRYKDFLPQVTQSRVVQRTNDSADVYLQLPLRYNLGTIYGVIRFVETSTADGLRVDGHLVRGNLTSFDLRLDARRLPDGRTRVVMQMRAVPALPLPESMVSGQQARAANRGIAAFRSQVDSLAQSSGEHL